MDAKKLLSQVKAFLFQAVFVVIGFSIVSGCADYGSGQVDEERDATISLQLRLDRPSDTDTPSFSASAVEPDICHDQRISGINIAISIKRNDEFVLSSFDSLECADHGTGVLAVPSNTELLIELAGLVDHRKCWEATVGGIVVSPGSHRHVRIEDLLYQCSDETPPDMINQYPASDAVDVGLGESVNAVFDEKIAPSSVYDNAVILLSGQNQVPGIISHAWDTNTISFNPIETLEPSTTYEVVLDNTGGDIMDTAMNRFGRTERWLFTTTAGPPAPPNVVGTHPTADAIDVAHDISIRATFSKPIQYSAIGDDWFTLSANGSQIAGSHAYDAPTRTLTFHPGTILSLTTEYTATLSDQILDEDGLNLILPFQWRFTTGGLPSPTHLRIISLNLLEWDPVSPAPQGYNLYMRTEGNDYDYNSPIWSGPSTSAFIEGLASGQTYHFVVRAYIANGNESGISNEVSLLL